MSLLIISTPKKYQLATRPSPTLALPPRQSAAHELATRPSLTLALPPVSLPRTILRCSIPDLAAASGRPKKTQTTRRATLAPPPRQSAVPVSHQQTSDPWFPRCER